jgi:hypothetical protein
MFPPAARGSTSPNPASDLVVRCEFEREGVEVPPAARFMQVPVDLALQIFDYSPISVSQVEAAYKIAPRRISSREELLIDSAQTDRFSITRLTIPSCSVEPLEVSCISQKRTCTRWDLNPSQARIKNREFCLIPEVK